MRKKLADLRGKLVAWRGWETSSRHNKTWICVSKAKISLWDGKTCIKKSFNNNVIQVDHFWLTADNKKELHPQQIAQYEKIGGLGIVKTYMRNDGTIDYTIRKPSNIYCVESFIEALNEHFKGMAVKERIQHLSYISNILNNHTLENPTVYSLNYGVDKFKDDIFKELEYLQSCDVATDKALKTVKMNGKCKKLNLFKLPKKSISKTKGF